MHKIKEQLMRELKKFESMGELSAGSLEAVHKLTDTIKNIDKIEMLEDGGYSQGGEWNAQGSYARGGNSYGRGSSYDGGTSYGGGMSYARGRGRNARRDSMGRYSRGGVSEMLSEMMEYAETDQQRQAIERCMREFD